MDLICPSCGEHWGFDTLHDEAAARFEEQHPDVTGIPDGLRDEYSTIFSQVGGEFRSAGCVALGHVGGEQCEKVDNALTACAQAAYELLGDDMDGAAAMLEDEGF